MQEESIHESAGSHGARFDHAVKLWGGFMKDDVFWLRELHEEIQAERRLNRVLLIANIASAVLLGVTFALMY